MSQASTSDNRWIQLSRLLLYSGLVIGMACALYQWSINRSLWIDEAKLAINLLERSFAELLSPLDREQAAPIGYLWLQKAVLTVFGASERSLRLLPLLSYFISIRLLYLLCKRWFNNAHMQYLTAALFAGCYAMVYYASEVKQYGADVLIALLLAYMLARDRQEEKATWGRITVVGLLGIFCSNISAVVLPLFALNIVYQFGFKQGRWTCLVPVVVWGLGFAGYYFAFVHGHPSQKVLQVYWGNYFMPLNLFSADPYAFLWNTLVKELLAFQTSLGRSVYVLLALLGIGVFACIKQRRYWPVFLFIGMLFGHLLLSGLRLYPLAGRTALYTLPWGMLLIAAGLSFISDRLFKGKAWTYPLQALLVFVLLYPTWKRLPVQREELKQALEVISKEQVPAHKLYVYPYSKAAMDVYQKLGTTNLTSELRYFKRDTYPPQVESVTSDDLWFLGSHVQMSNAGTSDEEILLTSFKNNGFVVVDQWSFPGAFLYHLKRD